MQVESLEHSYFYANKLMEKQKKHTEAEQTWCILMQGNDSSGLKCFTV